MHTLTCEGGSQAFTEHGVLAPSCLILCCRDKILFKFQLRKMKPPITALPNFGRVKNQVSWDLRFRSGPGRVLLCESTSLVGRAQPSASVSCP